MKTRIVAYGLMVFTAIIVFYSCAIRKSEPITGKVVDTKDVHVRNGETLFMTYCHKCHPIGEGGLAPALNTLKLPKFVKAFQVRHGLGAMPYFKKDQISKENLHDIVVYMIALQKL